MKRRTSFIKNNLLLPIVIAMAAAPCMALGHENDADVPDSYYASPAAGSGEGGSSSESSVEDGTNASQLAQVVVSARKRTENLQDIPIPITVVDTNILAQRGELSLQDYYASVPGLSIVDSSNGFLSISIRGMSSSRQTNPTVGVTIDDVPIGSTDDIEISGAVLVPQLDPADLERIEFLKGPQGTLYGASTLAGVVRYVTKTPSLTGTTGHFEVDGSGVSGGDGGYGLRGSVNVPLVPSTAAVQISGFGRRDPGFVDNPTRGEDNVNSAKTFGGRVAFLVQPSEQFSARLSALFQRKEGRDGTVDTDYRYQPILGGSDLTQTRFPGTGSYDYRTLLYTATLDYNMGFFDITSITGYGEVMYQSEQDVTLALGPLAQIFFPNQGATGTVTINTNKFTQELRLSSPIGSQLEWQLGGFFTHENNPYRQQVFGNDLQTGVQLGDVATLALPQEYQERSVFGNTTYHFTKELSLQLGARESWNREQSITDYSGPLFGPVPVVHDFRSQDRSFTYLITPQWRLSDSLMAYASVATGYQPGGYNLTDGVPPTVKPSKDINYELGLKLQAFERRLSLNTDVFLINWSDIQVNGFTPEHFGYVFNGGKARSQGFEASADLIPLGGLSINASFAYIDAKLTSDAGNGFPGHNGDALPFSSKISGSLSAEDRFRITGATEGFAGATVSYVGRRYESFPANVGQLQPSIPAYAVGNLRGGIVNNGYTVTAFVKNVTNKRGVLDTQQQTGANATSGVWYTTFITPRVFGVSVSKSF